MTNRRRWLLRGAIVACLVGGILAWIGWRAFVRRATIDAILKFDASVYAQFGEHEYQPLAKISVILGEDDVLFPWLHRRIGHRAMGYSVVDEPPRYIAWAVPVFGDRIGVHVTEVCINDRRFSDGDVGLLLELPDLRALDLSGTSITDEGLAKLVASMDQLMKLDVSDTKVTGRSTRLLANCKNLRQVDLIGIADSETVAEELQRSLPDCLIFRE